MYNGVAYNVRPDIEAVNRNINVEIVAVENYYELPRRPLPNLPNEANANQQDYRGIKISAAIAISALVSALLALLVAIIALRVSAGVEHPPCTCNSTLSYTLNLKIGTYGHPADSCSELPQENPSGGYWPWIQGNTAAYV